MGDDTETQVLQAASPKDALLVIARALDKLLDSKQQAPVTTDWTATWEEPAVRIDVDSAAGTTEVQLQAPSEEKYQRRMRFAAQALNLSAHYGNETDWDSIYAQGGPLWLYINDRALVMSLPDATKQELVEDVIEDDPQEAHLMSIDILKQPCESGPGSSGSFLGEGSIG